MAFEDLLCHVQSCMPITRDSHGSVQWLFKKNRIAYWSPAEKVGSHVDYRWMQLYSPMSLYPRRHNSGAPSNQPPMTTKWLNPRSVLLPSAINPKGGYLIPLLYLHQVECNQGTGTLLPLMWMNSIFPLHYPGKTLHWQRICLHPEIQKTSLTFSKKEYWWTLESLWDACQIVWNYCAFFQSCR